MLDTEADFRPMEFITGLLRCGVSKRCSIAAERREELGSKAKSSQGVASCQKAYIGRRVNCRA